MREHAKFLGREHNQLAATRDTPRTHIHLQVGCVKQHGLLRNAAPQQRTHAGEQFRECEGLHEVIICAEVEPLHAITHAIACGKHQHTGGHGGGTQLAQHGEAVTLWKHHVEDDEVKTASLGLLEP